jgi:tRNA nucleotidyltransferase (CCA-adding enzyme)
MTNRSTERSSTLAGFIGRTALMSRDPTARDEWRPPRETPPPIAPPELPELPAESPPGSPAEVPEPEPERRERPPAEIRRSGSRTAVEQQPTPRRNGAAAICWEHYPHDADVGIRGRGPTRAIAYEQAALAMVAIVVDPRSVAESQSVDVDCEAPDDELLLVDWLNALIYEMATRRLCFGRFTVRLRDHRLHGRAFGEHIDLAKHELGVELKGATYTDLRVTRAATGTWVAQCVIDV